MCILMTYETALEGLVAVWLTKFSTGSRTRSGAYGVLLAMRQILHPNAVQSIMRRRNSVHCSSDLRGMVQGNIHA